LFWRVALAASVIVCVLSAGIAARNRTPWSDEGWFSSASFNLARHGFLGTTVIESAGTGLTRIERRTYWVMPLYLVGQALWYKFLPSDVLSTRVFTIVWAPVALFAFYVFLAKLLPGSRAPALATCLLALSYVFIDNAGFARPDLMCCALGLCGLATYVALRERHLKGALFLSNAFIAASGLTHPNGLFHLTGLLVVILWFDRRRLGVAAVALGCLPYALFGLGWGWYIAQDYRAFLGQMGANGSGTDRWSATLNPALILWNEIRYRYLVAFGFVTRGWALVKAFTLCAYVAAAAGCVTNSRLRRQPAVRLVLFLLAVYFVGMSVFNQKLSYYLVHIVPFYLALLAIGVTWLWTAHPAHRRAVAAGVLLLVGVEVGGILLKAYKRSYMATQRPAMAFLLAHTGPNDRIVGTAALIYELHFDPRLRDDPYLGLTSGREPDAIVIDPLYRGFYEGWQTRRPDAWKQTRERLSTYTLAYRNAAYDIYLRPGRAISTGH
jgi:hypothetical protein